MSKIHEADVTVRLSRFLDRRQMPKRLEGKEAAIADEVRALVAVVLRYAPRDPDRLAAWWPGFERTLGENSTGLWPIEREIRDAAGAINKASASGGPSTEWKIDEAELAARRMREGQQVGEGWLWGRMAVDMIARGLIDRETMEKYRSALFLANRKTYGEEFALAREAECKARHQAAIEMRRASEPATARATVPTMTGAIRGDAA